MASLVTSFNAVAKYPPLQPTNDNAIPAPAEAKPSFFVEPPAPALSR
jgi:hypothetical protein